MTKGGANRTAPRAVSCNRSDGTTVLGRNVPRMGASQALPLQPPNSWPCSEIGRLLHNFRRWRKMGFWVELSGTKTVTSARRRQVVVCMRGWPPLCIP